LGLFLLVILNMHMKLLIIDNYDSFTFNLVELMRQCNIKDYTIMKNDMIDMNAISNYDKIILSPGAGKPSDAGMMPEVLKRFAETKCILGICLGHQAIAEHYGGRIIQMDDIIHGIASKINILNNEEILFRGITQGTDIGRYHSLVVEKGSLPEELEVTAIDEKGNIMALRHRYFDIRGVQFHPESIMTIQGTDMIKNWLLF